YLAAGLPVVTTALPALAGVEEVDIIADAPGLVAAVEAEMSRDTPDRRRTRSDAARAHSWESRIEEIESALAGHETPRTGGCARKRSQARRDLEGLVTGPRRTPRFRHDSVCPEC